MYTKYETAQYTEDENGGYVKHDQPPQKVFNALPKPYVLPTKLALIFDMEVIDGSQVYERYRTLSYSWNKFGDSEVDKTTGKETRDDKGEHKIIRPDGSRKNVKFEDIIQQIYQQFTTIQH
ncbi:hypothetical protein INT45_010159 [Circinella minor]|uniref:Uncharacterized protein n=1 Tax=Circinella minor TaxID=1195481 RepID=A0A8H7VN82_9FUNG|nr:hypothetical protein INT45_010159 [Circinella minor]